MKTMMNKLFFFAVKRGDFPNSVDVQNFSENLIRGFPNEDFMRGYALGYGFGKISILTAEDVAHKNNLDNLGDYYIFPVELEDDDE